MHILFVIIIKFLTAIDNYLRVLLYFINLVLYGNPNTEQSGRELDCVEIIDYETICNPSLELAIPILVVIVIIGYYYVGFCNWMSKK